MSSRLPLLLAGLLAIAGCSIDPVITTPAEGGAHGLYDGCNRAARDYCKDVVGAADADMRRCVSEHTYECVAGPSAPQ